MKFAVWIVLATGLVVLDALLLRSLHILAPVLLVPIALSSVQWPLRFSLAAMLWLGFLLEGFSLEPFGLFLLTGVGMWALAVWMHRRGVDFSRWLSMLAASAALLGWQYFVSTGTLLIVGGAGSSVVLLVYAAWQLLLTFLAGLLLFRIAGRIMKV